MSATEDTAVVEAVDAADAAPQPRIRWAGIVWGLAFAAIAATGLWVVTSPERSADLAAWAENVEAGALIAYSLLAVGALVLLAGLVGLLRRAQVAWAARDAGE